MSLLAQCIHFEPCARRKDQHIQRAGVEKSAISSAIGVDQRCHFVLKDQRQKPSLAC